MVSAQAHVGPSAAAETSLSSPSSQVSARHGSLARGFLGFALVGWGLAILLQVTPHEDPYVGAGLFLFGLALVLTAPRLPRVPRLPAALVAGLGWAVVALVAAHAAWAGARVDGPKVALLAWGTALAAMAPVLERRWTLPVLRRPTGSVNGLAGASAVVLGAPLIVWGAQALFKGAVGTTPTEAFVRVALLIPLHAFLALMGWRPETSGQSITYATTGGLLKVDVGAACSGLQAMALFGAVLALYLFTERPTGRRLALWATIGLVGVYVANVIRLFTLTVVGYFWGGDALMQAHAQAGWIFFVGWALLFAWAARGRATRPVAS